MASWPLGDTYGGDRITRTNYIGELRKLLAGMTPADREDALNKYEDMFDKADSDEELIARLGSPTFVALGELRGYTLPEGYIAPSSATAEIPIISDAARVPTGMTGKVPVITGKAPVLSPQAAAEPRFVSYEPQTPPREPEEEPPRELHPGKLILYIILAVAIGVPVSLALVALSVAFLAAGAALMGAGVFVISTAFLGMDIFVDMMLLLGAGLAVAALGLPVVFFAVWFFWRAAVSFISWIFRTGGEWCVRREDDRESDEDLDYGEEAPKSGGPALDYEPGDYDPAHYTAGEDGESAPEPEASADSGEDGEK